MLWVWWLLSQGGCPTMYFRDMTATIKEVQRHRLWVALEAGSGIVPQHDYDPESSCAGWGGCEYWSHGLPGAWWNVTSDPFTDGEDESWLWAFVRHRALNRLALRTKLPILSVSSPGRSLTDGRPTDGRPTDGPTDGGALVYLKHDAMGPHGDACVGVGHVELGAVGAECVLTCWSSRLFAVAGAG